MSSRTGTGRNSASASTLLEALEASLGGMVSASSGDLATPAAVLWTDATGEWKPLLPVLLERLPELLVYGPYDATFRSGPAIWIKCVIGGVLKEARLPDGAVPIVYLPEISRQTLRAAADCPRFLQPLVELQYRGTVWTQRNGKDWTVEAFLVSADALGLEVARDMRTREAMLGALVRLAETPLTDLRGRRLDADDFDHLLVGDPARDLLRWMNDPNGTRKAWSEETWKAFRSRAKSVYGVDPEKDGEIVAGGKLGRREEGPWRDLWDRYAEAPGLYKNIPELLERAKPLELIFEKETWPDENRKDENGLRDQLTALGAVGEATAREKVAELENEHGKRRQWIWARLGHSPLAAALEYLAILAARTASPLGGDSPDEMARVYAEGGFLADDAVLRALASVRTAEDVRAVRAAIRSLYAPWLDAACERFQERVVENPLPPRDSHPSIEVSPGECVLFVDGLRFDLAKRLVAALDERSLSISESLRWAAQPTVTATAKSAVSPIAEALDGLELGETFAPTMKGSGQALTPDRFRRQVEELGYVFIASDENRDPSTGARGWTEFGNIDRRGHDLGEELPWILDEMLDRLAERITGLLDFGWSAVRVITDHGWLLMPGGLRKFNLPKYLVETRWARVALVKGESRVSVRRFPWHWNHAYEYASAPGCACFKAGHVYAHGGVSLQECVLLDLAITPGATASPRILAIKEVKWVRLRCRVLVDPGTASLTVDIRRKTSDKGSSVVAEPKATDHEGRASVLVDDEDLAGEAAVVVITDADGQVLATRPTILGGEE